MPYKLRDYQEKAVEAVFREWETVDSTALILPTGAGKTVVFASIIERMQPKRCMVLAHRQELIFQARDKIIESSGLRVEMEMGDYRASNEAGLPHDKSPVIVSTVQTHVAGGDGGGRMGKFDPQEFGLLVIDEVHHGVSASYQKVINYYRQNAKLKVLGVTATPDRADEEALGQILQTVAFDYEIPDAIADGWLVEVDQQFITINGLDFSNVRTTAGDLNGADLAAIMEMEKNLYGVVDSSIEIIGNKRAIVFTASVAHAQMASGIFNRYVPGMSAWICGKTDKDERAKILRDFRDGIIQVVCNCGVLTEGFDDAGVEVIVMARPTKSRALYAQMMGRATRPLPGVVDGPKSPMGRRMAIRNSAKRQCVILDFCGNSGRHKLITTADILGGKVSDVAIESAIIRAKQSGQRMKMSEVLKEEEEKAQEIEKRRLEREARRANLVVKASYSAQSVNPFDLLGIRPVKSRGWDSGKQFSEKQAAMLKRNGADPNTIGYAQGKQLLTVIGKRIENHLCTVGQAKTLAKYNVPDATNITFEHASKIIDAIAKNGWKKPEVLPLPPTKAERKEAMNQPQAESEPF
jgi:superfamily II DNA or RNA helicase